MPPWMFYAHLIPHLTSLISLVCALLEVPSGCWLINRKLIIKRFYASSSLFKSLLEAYLGCCTGDPGSVEQTFGYLDRHETSHRNRDQNIGTPFFTSISEQFLSPYQHIAIFMPKCNIITPCGLEI